MVLDVSAARSQFVEELRKAPKASAPADLQSYVGSPVPALGLSVPTMRAIVAAFAKDHRALNAAEVNALADALWSGPLFEEKSLAILLLGRYEKILDDDSWRLGDGWVDAATGWGLSDGLASGPIAGMVYAKASRFQDILRWTLAKNIWRRRASTYALHRFVRAGELDKPFHLLEKLLYDDEFWVQRAVGTWLRECWKQDRRRTEAFLRKHVHGLPNVVIRIATERAPKGFRDELRRGRAKRAPVDDPDHKPAAADPGSLLSLSTATAPVHAEEQETCRDRRACDNERCGTRAGNGGSRSQSELVNGHRLERAHRDGFLTGLIPRGRHAEEVDPWRYGRQYELSVRIRDGLCDQDPAGEEPDGRVRNRVDRSAGRGSFDDSASNGSGRIRDWDDGEVQVVPGDARVVLHLNTRGTLANRGGHVSVVAAGENPSRRP